MSQQLDIIHVDASKMKMCVTLGVQYRIPNRVLLGGREENNTKPYKS